MFFIMGISQKEKKLNYDQTIVCKCCGKYGHISVYMHYTYLMLFFIPVIKWNKHYYLFLSCCGTKCEINKELGKAIEKGEIASLDTDMLNFTCNKERLKYCSFCGFSNTEDYRFCPKCGNPF